MEGIATYEVRVRETAELRSGPDYPPVTLVVQGAVALGAVRTLDAAARSIREKGFTAAAFESIDETTSCLGEYFRKSEALEERHLMPVIGRTDPEMAKEFREERRLLRNLFTALRALIGEIERGRIHGSSVAELLRIATEVVTRLRKHIIRQNDLLAPPLGERRAAAGNHLSGSATTPPTTEAHSTSTTTIIPSGEPRCQQ